MEALAQVRAMVASRRVPGGLPILWSRRSRQKLARMLAKTLVCERNAGDFCDACPRCRKAEEMFTTTSVVLPWSTWAIMAMLLIPGFRSEHRPLGVYYYFTMAASFGG